MSDNVFKGKYLTVNASAKYPFQGYFGYQGTWQNTTKVSVVILKKEDCRDDWKSTVGEYHQSKLDALHVLKIVGYEEDSDWRYFAFQPYAVTLYEYVNSPEKYKGLALPSDLVVLYQIISAVHFLHDIEIVHGDLNPLTICIESDNSETGLMVSARIKVRRSLSKNNANIFKYEEHAGNEQQLEDLKICKSKYWRRAERIDCQPEYGDDIFAVGCLLYYFIKGQHPFAECPYSSNKEKILENISKKKTTRPTHFFAGQYDTCIFIDLDSFAYKYIERMILPENGTYDWLRDFRHAKIAFKNALPLKIDFKELLGEGAFGYVYKGTYEGKDVAVKVVDKLNEKQRIEYAEHLRLTHENVVKLLHVHDSKDGLRTYLVLELCIATLADYFTKEKKGLPDLPENKVHFLYQLVVGLHYIHNCNLVHRDLKPDNILVFLQGKSLCLKISDFGLCKKTDERGYFSQNKNTVKVGDSIALAPERIKAKEDARKMKELDGKKLKDAGTRFSDIFELAIVLYYIFTGGQHPFQNEGKEKKIIRNIMNDNPAHLNKEFQKHNTFSLEGKILNSIKGMLAHKPPKDRTPLPEVIGEFTKMLCDNNRTLTEFRGFDKCYDAEFHPKEPVLALASDCGKLILYSAENGSIPFSNWKKTELCCSFVGKIFNVKWNLDGTLLAGVCQSKGHEFIVNVWSYQHNGARLSHNILFQRIHLVLFQFGIEEFDFAIEWNPYSPNEFAVLCRLELEMMSITPVNTDALLRPFCRKRNNKLYLINVTSMDNSEINIGESMSKRKFIWISEELIIFITGFIINIYSIKNGRLLKSVEIFEREVNGSSQSEKKLEQLYDNMVDCVWDKKTQCLAICYEKRIEILSLGSNGLESLHKWTNPDGEKVFTAMAWLPNFNHPNDENIETARKSPDNFIFACATQDNSKIENGEIVIWTPLKEQTIKNTHDLGFNLVSSLSFSPDGQFLVAERIGINVPSRMIVVSTKNWWDEPKNVPLDIHFNVFMTTPFLRTWKFRVSWMYLSMDVADCKLIVNSWNKQQVVFVEYAVASDEEIIKQRKLEERLIENWNKAFQHSLTKLILE